ncbi:MAG: hypothetical protein AAFQ41_02840 [Cyanobacteria bacterium J06623_7]
MHSLKSRNYELNSYINTFLDAHYQPGKMLWWRIVTLSSLGLTFLIRDYRAYQFALEHWFAWTPVFTILTGFLTIDFRSLYLGSMSFQYRQQDTAFTIARQFAAFDYPPLVRGMSDKLTRCKQICNRFYLVLMVLFVGVRMILWLRPWFLPTIVENSSQYLIHSIYTVTILGLVLAAAIASGAILIQKKQLELLELSLFWIESASSLKFIE